MTKLISWTLFTLKAFAYTMLVVWGLSGTGTGSGAVPPMTPGTSMAKYNGASQALVPRMTD
jgi:hypothetical protein